MGPPGEGKCVSLHNAQENLHLPVRLINFSSESVSKFEGGGGILHPRRGRKLGSMPKHCKIPAAL
jgi:hypothetical protein